LEITKFGQCAAGVNVIKLYNFVIYDWAI
jgi:hypothetical protein